MYLSVLYHYLQKCYWLPGKEVHMSLKVLIWRDLGVRELLVYFLQSWPGALSFWQASSAEGSHCYHRYCLGTPIWHVFLVVADWHVSSYKNKLVPMPKRVLSILSLPEMSPARKAVPCHLGAGSYWLFLCSWICCLCVDGEHTKYATLLLRSIDSCRCLIRSLWSFGVSRIHHICHKRTKHLRTWINAKWIYIDCYWLMYMKLTTLCNWHQFSQSCSLIR